MSQPSRTCYTIHDGIKRTNSIGGAALDFFARNRYIPNVSLFTFDNRVEYINRESPDWLLHQVLDKETVFLRPQGGTSKESPPPQKKAAIDDYVGASSFNAMA